MISKTQAAHVRLLIRTLRSGEFKQCKHQLYDGSRFCASGVACELYARSRSGLDAAWRKESIPRSEWAFQAGNQSNIKTMPFLVQEWFGMSDRFFIPAALVKPWKLDPYRDMISMTMELLNDGVKACSAFQRSHRGLTFTEIADVLEKWLQREQRKSKS